MEVKDIGMEMVAVIRVVGITNSIDMGIAGLLFLATILIIFTKSF